MVKIKDLSNKILSEAVGSTQYAIIHRNGTVIYSNPREGVDISPHFTEAIRASRVAFNRISPGGEISLVIQKEDKSVVIREIPKRTCYQILITEGSPFLALASLIRYEEEVSSLIPEETSIPEIVHHLSEKFSLYPKEVANKVLERLKKEEEKGRKMSEEEILDLVLAESEVE